MAAGRKAPTKRHSSEARAFTVILEQMLGEFRVFGEALTRIHETVDRIAAKLDRCLDTVDRGLERVETNVALAKTSGAENGREV